MAITVRDTKDTVFIINDDKGNPLYRIRPYSQNYLCYQVDEWATVKTRGTKETRTEWKALECYPWNLAHACDIIKGWLIMRGGVTTSDLTELKKVITRSTNLVMKAVEEGFENGRSS